MHKKSLMRDATNIVHHGAGPSEITFKSHVDIENAKPLLICSYETS